MRVLVDECLPRRLKQELPEHEVRTVTEMGWNGMKNGILLQNAARNFDVFLTADQNLQYQQNLEALPIPVVVLVASSNDINIIQPLMSKVREALPNIQAGQLYKVGP
jgi:predicted nuclease of predicted toxin-antitoxin system